MVRVLSWSAVVSLLLSLSLSAANAGDRIRDNVFLLEEAFNQEPGVVQHISSLEVDPKSKSWTFTFTDEWPVPDDLNQLSLTLELGGTGPKGRPEPGDTLVNWRYQAVGRGGKGWLFVTPRVSVVLPTGSVSSGTSRGAIGLQFAVAISMEPTRCVALHLLGETTITPSARTSDGRFWTAVDVRAGGAIVLQPLSWLDPFVEVVYENVSEPKAEGFGRGSTFVVSPGIRAALNVSIGELQIVPGIGAPMTFDGRGLRSFAMIAYLSFEHRMFEWTKSRSEQ